MLEKMMRAFIAHKGYEYFEGYEVTRIEQMGNTVVVDIYYGGHYREHLEFDLLNVLAFVYSEATSA